MTLEAEIRVSRGSFALDARLRVPGGGVLALIGPNGAGKSTLLDVVAGLSHCSQGFVHLSGRDLSRLQPHRRPVGLLRQQPLLFPHLSALDNVAFGIRARGAGKKAARSVAARWLAEVDAADLASRTPRQLSGGQAQRVALARVLATEPELLLLDEPLAALDVDAAPAMRALLRRVMRAPANGRSAVLVTHDPLDALALADTLVVLGDGRIVQTGPTREVLAAPRSEFTARLAGTNLVAGIAVADGVRTSGGELLCGLHSADAVLSEPAVAVFAPSAVSVYPATADQRPGSPRNTASATVASVEPYGPVVRMWTAPAPGWAGRIAADLTPAAAAELAIEPGSAVTVAVKATAVEVHPGGS